MENIFWVNQNVIRIDGVSFIDQLRKKTVYIDKWNADNLIDICYFVKKKHNAKTIYTSVNSNVKCDIALLKKSGFSLDKKISKRTYLGFSKSEIVYYKQSEV